MTRDETPFEEVRDNEGALILDLDGYEGPLDVLLTLARSQKVDLARISILQLAEQYLAFIGSARQLRLEIAAEYLVMAAWLAYLKSRLLLPEVESEEDEPSAAEMAEALAHRLRRLEAMRDVAGRLMARPQLGQEVFAGGAPEGLSVETTPVYHASLFELLDAYARHRTKRAPRALIVEASHYYSMESAYRRLTGLLGSVPDWESLTRFLPDEQGDRARQRSALASTLAASLELAREGKLSLRQSKPFGAIYLRRKELA